MIRTLTRAGGVLVVLGLLVACDAAPMESGEEGATPDASSAEPGPIEEPGVEADAVAPVEPEADPGRTDPPVVPDASPPAPDAPVPEACEPGSGCFGEPCDAPDDCLSGLCVDHMDGRVCSKACDVTCPQGFSCREVTLGGADIAFICVSDHPNLCRPCEETNDCVSQEGVQDACVLYGTWNGGKGDEAGAEGRFCASACGQDADCPEDFSCREVTSAEGAVLVPGDAIAWTSDIFGQGSVGHHDNGCAAKGTCGLPYSHDGLGGGWQLCFA
mgnify:CR=1 FL=1